MKRGRRYKSLPSHTATHIDSVKRVEKKLNSLLCQMEPNYQPAKSATGGFEPRISQIMKVASKIEESLEKNKTNEKRVAVEKIPIPEKTNEPKSNNKTEQHTSVKKRTTYKPFDFYQNTETSFTKYFQVSVPEQLKRSINPYKAVEDITKTIGETPKDFISFNKSSFTVKVSSEEQARKLTSLSAIDEVICKVNA